MEDRKYLELEGPEDEELGAEPEVEEPVEIAEEPAEKTTEPEETVFYYKAGWEKREKKRVSFAPGPIRSTRTGTPGVPGTGVSPVVSAGLPSPMHTSPTTSPSPPLPEIPEHLVEPLEHRLELQDHLHHLLHPGEAQGQSSDHQH